MAENVRTIHITKALTTSMILHLINEYQNLSEITCAPSVYERTSSKYIDALNELGIKVNKKYNWGAKPRTNGAEFEVLELSNAGLSPKEIAQKLDITLNRVYYLLRKKTYIFMYFSLFISQVYFIAFLQANNVLPNN